MAKCALLFLGRIYFPVQQRNQFDIKLCEKSHNCLSFCFSHLAYIGASSSHLSPASAAIYPKSSKHPLLDYSIVFCVPPHYYLV